MSDLFRMQADLAGTGTRITDGENRYGMSFAAVALGTAGAMTDDALEQGTAEDVSGRGELRGEPIKFADSDIVFH